MIKKVLLGILLLSTVFTYSQDITGEWNGLLKIQGMQMRLVFHISKTDTVYQATMDSPDQGANGIPMTSASFKNSVLTIKMIAAQIEYTGTLDSSGIVTGTFKQAGQSLPMNLSRKAIEKVQVKRSQEPTKPYPYYSEEVSFENKKDSITLAGTLTLPKKTGKFPVVVLITGSGPQNRDEELMGHKPFLILADFLTRNGIGVLRFDDRGSFASKGNFAKATTADFAWDVEAAVNYLETRKEIDLKRIGLIGHSEGGIIAPIVAARRKDIRFIVLMAGTAIPGSELLMLQQELIGRASGMKEEDLIKAADINRGAYDMIINSKDDSKLTRQLSDYLSVKTKDIPGMEIPEGKSASDMIQAQITQISSPWMLYFIRYNPALVLEKVNCPVLAVNGSKDLQVPAKINLPAIEKALKKGGNKQVTALEFPGLNHLFQECTTGLPKEYGEIDQTISPVALKEMSNWIKNTIK